MSPLEVIEHMWGNHREVLHDMIGSNPREFWSKVRADDPKLLALGTLCDIVGWEDITYPMIVHGDGARFTTKNSNSLVSVQVKSVLSKSNFDIDMLPFSVAQSCSG